MLAKYIGPEILSYYGFNEGEPSIGPLFTENNRMYMLYIGYFNEKNMHILIARSKDTRGKEELFLEIIPNMTDEESLGPRNKEFYNYLKKVVRRKNRISGKSLLEKIEEVTCTTTPF